MKPCRKCSALKLLSDYYRHSAMGDGYLNFCKECVRQRVTNHRKRNVERIRQYDRERGMLPHRVQQRRLYLQTERGRAVVRKIKDAWIKRNPDKRAVHIMTGNAIRAGKLIKQPCTCGRTDVHAHHDNYSKPFEVRWLCPGCHNAHHRRHI